MTGRNSAGSSASPPNFHQNPAETLHIRRLDNGLARPGGRSGENLGHFSSLVVADAFAGALTRGSFKTIPASEETTNTQRFEAMINGVRVRCSTVEVSPTRWKAKFGRIG